LLLGFKWLEVAGHKWLYVITISDEDFMILFDYFTFLYFLYKRQHRFLLREYIYICFVVNSTGLKNVV
jgi:hypothetical protein